MLHVPIPPIDATALPVIRITVTQGQARVSANRRVELTTVLGSCVACCLFDASSGVGGMNHFLLAEPPGGTGVDEHYGVYLMEVLINEMLAHGAARQAIRAHLYGGATMFSDLARIGDANIRFAENFLTSERIPLAKSSLGGTQARRLDFRPARGQARCLLVDDVMAPKTAPMARPHQASGDVELF